MTGTPGERPLEAGVRVDFHDAMSYADYLALDQVLTAQHPLSSPPHHDELLFIIQHQTSELWLKLMLHELRAARAFLDTGRPEHALKTLARVKQILRSLTEQWSVLATLTPSEYAEFRAVLGSSSGFQSAGYRAVEFILGNKNARMLRMFTERPAQHAELETVLREPSVYDAFLRLLARRGHTVPRRVLDRDVSKAWALEDGLVPMFTRIYEHVAEHWDVYELCESLIDIEDAFQLWRFRHLSTVQRIIGFKRGTGGSSGVGFLRKALDLTFFPELIAARTEIRDLAVG
ncbi:tryptophan 2,3-dioxygenase [Leucobacter chromiireducens]|uniref:Tryptophan 2,3-dioxygenase n=1 Tax=Leucobacter chromiireducens subsp. solipictus TaxID=398235 RepID=A0ABS1SHD1_9MICO|nr:tryptophan 2,3-dioxygenase family protein [Leucobacter chromiireducens]MBL3679732.1 tryptophan 2,3-dioxygenase [Leucobacter chromiireducens subsp. solipictus]